MSINVKVKLFADLRRYRTPGLGDPQRMELPVGATINDILLNLGIPLDYELTAGVNGELGERGTVLKDGDEVMLLSPMDGG